MFVFRASARLTVSRAPAELEQDLPWSKVVPALVAIGLEIASGCCDPVSGKLAGTTLCRLGLRLQVPLALRQVVISPLSLQEGPSQPLADDYCTAKITARVKKQRGGGALNRHRQVGGEGAPVPALGA